MTVARARGLTRELIDVPLLTEIADALDRRKRLDDKQIRALAKGWELWQL
jgi:hypothetical protein